MSYFYFRHDQLLDSHLSELLSLRNDEKREPFELPGTEPQYAPDRKVDVTHIKLDLTFEIENKTMHGTAEISFTTIQGHLHRVTLDAAEMEILKVSTPDGHTLNFEHTGSKLHIELSTSLEKDEESVVIIDYKVVEPRLGLYFVLPDDDYQDKPVQIWTQGQDEDSKYWFPCFDYPNEKATSELIATVDEKYFALSNGVLAETRHDKSAGTKTYHWYQDVPHVSYLISLVVGEYVERTEYYKDIPLSYYVQPGREEEGERSFGKTPDMVKFFSEKLNFDYPYKKYAQIVVEDFVFGGMENTSATTQTAMTLHDERAHQDYESEPLVAHELAHQWFGDLLTCKDWSHAWLNEGFATYFEALYREHDLGEAEFRYEMYQNAKQFFQEDGKYRRPIVTNKYREPIDLFDRHLYDKGSLVLHMLRYELGDELFWKVMHHYLETHQGGNVETIDLIRAIEEITGRNMKRFFDQWVFGAGYPELKVNYSWESSEDGKSGTAKVVIEQTQEVKDETPLFHFPVDLVFVTDNGPETKTVDVTEKQQVSYFQFSNKPERFYFDPKNWILKVVKLEVPQEMLLSQLTDTEDVMMRIDAAQALKEQPSAKIVNALGKALLEDSFWGVQTEIAKVLGEIHTERAMHQLVEGLKVENSKARRAVVDSLGNYHNQTVVEALKPYAKKDASYYVESAANASIGKTRTENAFEIVKASLGKESFNEVIRSGVFSAFAELDTDEAVSLILDYTSVGKPPLARAAAATALGKMGKDRKKAKQRLLDLLRSDEHFRVKIGAVTGLRHLNDASTIPVLKSFAESEPNGMLKRLANETARHIQSSQDQPKAVKELQKEVEKLRSDRMDLISRLEKLESRLESGK